MRFSLNIKVLFFFLVTVLLITFSISYIVFNSYEQTLISRTASELASIRDIKKKEIEDFLQEKRTDIELLAKSYSVITLMKTFLHEAHTDETVPYHSHSGKHITQDLKNFLPQYSQGMGFVGIHILAINHPDIVYSTMKDKLPDIHPGNVGLWGTDALFKLYTEVLRSNKTAYSDVVLYSKHKQPTFFLATPVKDHHQRSIGMIVFQFPGDSFTSILKVDRHLLSRSEEFYLVGADHLMRSNSHLDPVNRSLVNSLQYPEKGSVKTTASFNVLKGKTHTEFIKDYRGVDVLSSYTPINVSEKIQWGILAEIDKEDILVEINDVKRDSFYTLIIGLPLLMLFLYYIINKKLVRPLHHLKDSIVSITANQDFTQTVEAEGSMEIDAISKSFNTLLSTIVEANNEILKSHDLLEKGQSLANIGVWEINPKSMKVYFGTGVYKILNVDPNTFEPSLEAYLSFVHPEDKKAFVKTYHEAITHAVEGKHEHRIVREDGTIAYIEISYSQIQNDKGEVTLLNGLMVDYTLRKELELQLTSANTHLENRVREKTQDLLQTLKEYEYLFNTTIEGIMISKDGICIDTNEEAIKIFGYANKEEMIGLPMLDYVHDDFKDIVKKNQADNGVSIYEADLLRKDGSSFPAILKGHSFTNEEGSYRISATMDISELKHKESQLLLQSRHAQMGEMIAMIAHQWRQPLSSISATIGSLQMKQALGKYDPEFYDKQFQNISDFTQHLSRTIEDFRDFFKEEKKKKAIRLEDIADDSISIIRPLLEGKNITLNIDYQSNEEILSYPNELKQVFLNILKNAQEILEEKKVDMPRIDVSTYKDDDYLYFTIEDNAGGIEETIINKVFEPYFTTKGKLNGTGLGLYMSHKIIEEHCQGSLSVKNSNTGALFIGKIPRVLQKDR